MCFRVISLITIAVTAMLFLGCGEDTPTCRAVSASCTGGRTLKRCCTEEYCDYRVSDGEKFACKGTNCSSAAENATTYCNRSSGSDAGNSNAAVCTGVILRCGASSECGQWATAVINSNTTDQCGTLAADCTPCK